MNEFQAPTVDWAALSPELILLGGASVLLLVGVFLPPDVRRPFASVFAALCLAGAGAAAIVLFVLDDTGRGVVADAIRRDRLAELAQNRWSRARAFSPSACRTASASTAIA